MTGITIPPYNPLHIWIKYPIPRTHMTLVLLGKGLVLRGWPSKIEVIGALCQTCERTSKLSSTQSSDRKPITPHKHFRSCFKASSKRWTVFIMRPSCELHQLVSGDCFGRESYEVMILMILVNFNKLIDHDLHYWPILLGKPFPSSYLHCIHAHLHGFEEPLVFHSSIHLEGRVAFVTSRDQRPMEETARRTEGCISVLLFVLLLGGYVWESKGWFIGLGNT